MKNNLNEAADYLFKLTFVGTLTSLAAIPSLLMTTLAA